jgi:hypothetical protein
MAIFAGSIHFIPIAATTVICYLALAGYYVGSELTGPGNQDDAKFIGLLFAAKLHELTINASLTAVISSFVRYRLAVAGGLPFGALFTGLQFQQISFLWSMELWGAARARFLRLQVRLGIVLLVVTCAFISVSAGSSSATLMRPTLDDWPAGGTDFWIAMRRDEFMSLNVTSSQTPDSCLIDTGDFGCPYGDWQTIAQTYLSYYADQSKLGGWPLGVYIKGAHAIRYLQAQRRAGTFGDLERMSVATVPSSSVGDALVELSQLYTQAAVIMRGNGKWRFWSRNARVQSVEAYQPIVHGRCLQMNASDYASFTSTHYRSGNGNAPFYSLPDLKYYNLTGDFPIINIPIPNSFQALLQKANSSSVPQVAWANIAQRIIDDPKDTAASNTSDPTLGAMLSVPSNDKYGVIIYTCTIDSRLAPATVSTTAQDVVAGDPVAWWNAVTYGSNNTYPRISIDSDWARYLDPVVGPDNSSAFQSMLQTAGLWNSDMLIDLEGAQHSVESLLSTVVANGLARRDYGRSLAGSLLGDPNGVSTGELYGQEWAMQMMPAHGRAMGPGGVAFAISPSEEQNSTKFTMHTTANGYAYSIRGSAAKFAMSVLLFHTFIALCHWVYMSYSKQSSTSWESIAELVALAMNSRPSEVFANTGAGIDCGELFKDQTQVVERGDRLELVVGAPSGEEKTVVANKIYG